MFPPGACPRCLTPLPAVPAGGVLVFPECGSRVTGDTPPGDGRATAVEPRPPTVLPETVTAVEPHLAPTPTAGREFTIAPDTPAPTLPGYDDLELIGTGGMGVVYRAVQRGTQRVVAIKFLHAGGALDRGLRARFAGEAHALARVDHPNIVRIHDAGEDSAGRPYFVMEYVPGGSVARLVRAGSADPREAARILAGVAAAVEAAHRVSVLHRDIKPGNVLLTDDDTPKITDFGLARLGDRDDGHPVSGAVMGTPSYMAPEPAAGRRLDFDPRIDVYGLGATLYELLTGLPPFKGLTNAATLRLVEKSNLVWPSRLRRGVPPDLEAICVKCLAKDPRDRYPTAGEVADELNRFLAGKPTRARPPSTWGRARHWVRRNRVAVALLALVPLVALGAAVADPERRLDWQLAAGRPVTLIGNQGGPAWSEWKLGPVDLTRSADEDGTCGFQTHTTSVLLLARDPRCDRYTVSAELKHLNASADNAAVGVFVGLYDTPAGPNLAVTRFVGLQYSEFWSQAELKNPDLFKRNHGLDGRDLVVVRDGTRAQADACDYGVFRFTPVNNPPRHPWRRIRLDVSPAGVDVFWEPTGGTITPSRRIMAGEIEGMAAHQTSLWQQWGYKGFALPPRPWSPRGGLGVYACNSAVAVRNVTLHPAGVAP
jgi:serine/threonine-protein kinase